MLALSFLWQGRDLVNWTFSLAQYLYSVSLMNSWPLSASSPSHSKGHLCLISFSARKHWSWDFPIIGSPSHQPDDISVALTVHTCSPKGEPPQWKTRSASM